MVKPSHSAPTVDGRADSPGKGVSRGHLCLKRRGRQLTPRCESFSIRTPRQLRWRPHPEARFHVPRPARRDACGRDGSWRCAFRRGLPPLHGSLICAGIAHAGYGPQAGWLQGFRRSSCTTSASRRTPPQPDTCLHTRVHEKSIRVRWTGQDRLRRHAPHSRPLRAHHDRGRGGAGPGPSLFRDRRPEPYHGLLTVAHRGLGAQGRRTR